MLYRVKLKNANDFVLLDEEVFDFFSKDVYFKRVEFLENLRKHSSGCAFFQKSTKQKDGSYSTKTIYLHKFIAEKFLSAEDESEEKRLVGAKNGNKLDCRLKNLVFRTRSTSNRMRKTSNKTGFKGVYKENNRYRAVITWEGKPLHIGMYATAEEAAIAFNQKAKELYGSKGRFNNL